MRAIIRSSTLALLVGTSTVVVSPQTSEAQEYPIDCAILLCLSGGWPASVPCARARAEFIRRITPWPVEPPLQIWRCPMGASIQVDPNDRSTTRIWDALLDGMQTPLQSYPSAPAKNEDLALAPQPSVFRQLSGGFAKPLPDGFSLQLAQDYINEDGQADIDISAPEFNFVRSIRVYMIRGYQWESGNDGDEDCNHTSTVRLGSYGLQGGYRWTTSSVGSVPPAYDLPERWGDHCPTVSMRSVFVDWHDYEGRYGWERVDY